MVKIKRPPASEAEAAGKTNLYPNDSIEESKPYICIKCKARVYIKPEHHSYLCHLYKAEAGA